MITTQSHRRLNRAQIRTDLCKAVDAYVLIPPIHETARLIARLTRHLTGLIRLTERQAAACAPESVDRWMRLASLERARVALGKRPEPDAEGAADHALTLYWALFELIDYLRDPT
ncbi:MULTISPECIES: DUF6415 family natural product biosynthesis protein [Streptomyces]|uniref:DUF6415 family natural product biosynthesis protein n=1 Tax=Streptomyces TaxID=1883 RepID=UPI00163C1051|nr:MULTISPECIES: DUF6415 family natural product biosynthesis protein [Streptomyces]MBC2874045.1 hypothetical protein [Streptomyces sp. TYQ1024]UBI39020.1 DUF6415 family natural product biosynthesis protein [Streptomyces mobaraensis]UKW31598.1 DUF6415 family natural product biosynthesis protein [Streptomyces sp. TYQ1024]